jgi:hypothetical protein
VLCAEVEGRAEFVTMTSPEGKKSRVLLGITALGCFGLGLAVAGILAGDRGANDAGSVASASASTASSPPDVPDAALPDAGEPRIFFDPSSISLLPDASLHIELPEGWDAGDPP